MAILREFGLVARLFVDPAARRAGHARGLLETVTGYAAGQGLQPTLDVVDDSLAAIALYEGAGWQLVGTESATWVTPAGTTPTIRWYLAPWPDTFAPRIAPAASHLPHPPLPSAAGRIVGQNLPDKGSNDPRS